MEEQVSEILALRNQFIKESFIEEYYSEEEFKDDYVFEYNIKRDFYCQGCEEYHYESSTDVICTQCGDRYCSNCYDNNYNGGWDDNNRYLCTCNCFNPYEIEVDEEKETNREPKLSEDTNNCNK
ncbi:hypothetical protein ABK040_013693 [Willaertia magna]